MRIYKGSQILLCVIWFAFTVISTGSKDGWSKFGVFNKCADSVNVDGNNEFGFIKFLTLIEIFIFYMAIALGLRCIYKIEMDERVLNDPFEDIDQQPAQNEMNPIPNTENP